MFIKASRLGMEVALVRQEVQRMVAELELMC